MITIIIIIIDEKHAVRDARVVVKDEACVASELKC
jgi:hypothetical protein